MYCATLESEYDLLSIAVALPDVYPYLLDTAAPVPGEHCSLLLRSTAEQLCLHADGTLAGPGHGEGFLNRLNDWYLRVRCVAQGDSRWPFAGGWFVFLGYELAAEVEPVVYFPSADGDFPVAFASRCPAAIYTNPHSPGKLHLVAESESLLQAMQGELRALTGLRHDCQTTLCSVTEEPPGVFRDAIERVHEYILDGDVFQVNLSRGWQGLFAEPVDAAALYRALCRCNPAPFAGMVRWGEHVLLSSSPERLVRMNDGLVNSRPIAGTHPRGIDSDTDQTLSRQMIAHPKERAEHIMLIDLERNDLGRVCVTGSVEVSELMVVESYEHVHHIVSNVRGRLRQDVTPVDVIRAVFPGGTITGCPKVRCMEIIAELERKGRGFYTGSMGYLGVDGGMDLNILIRSMMVHGRRLTFRTGAGIVADSNPESEVSETRDKARGLLLALGQNSA